MGAVRTGNEASEDLELPDSGFPDRLPAYVNWKEVRVFTWCRLYEIAVAISYADNCAAAIPPAWVKSHTDLTQDYLPTLLSRQVPTTQHNKDTTMQR